MPSGPTSMAGIPGGVAGYPAVVAITGTVGSSQTLTRAAHNGKVMVNTAAAEVTLWTGGTVGDPATFYVAHSGGIIINAGTGQTIRELDQVTASAGNIRSTTVGESIKLVLVATATWARVL